MITQDDSSASAFPIAEGCHLWSKQYTLIKPLQATDYSDDFTYTPLDPAVDEIRLVIIEPGQDSDAIKCRLIHASLGKDSPTYEALSYCWGDKTEEGSVKILLNGKHFRIFGNLANALRRMRLRKAERFFWIDAICINQADARERGEQVHLMHRIYARALQTAIWLGEEYENSDGAMKFVEKLASHVEGLSEDFKVEDPDLSKWKAVYENAENFALWIAMYYLMCRPWWKRVWVIQEIIAATSATIYCGTESISWDRFQMVLGSPLKGKLLDGPLYFQSYKRGLSGGRNAELLESLRQKQREGHVPKLEEMLFTAWHYGASDPRDKVYALLSFAPLQRAKLICDYSRTTVDLYKDVVKQIVVESRSLEIICRSQHFEHWMLELAEFPSWCPDWSTPPLEDSWISERDTMSDRELIESRLPGSSPPHYEAAGSTAAVASFSEDLNTLTVEGFQLDVVERLYDQSSKDVLGIPMRQAARAAASQSVWRIGDTHHRISSYFQPPAMKAGDVVCILFGCSHPVVLRRMPYDNSWLFIGDCFIHAYMHGEAMQYFGGTLGQDEPARRPLQETFVLR